MIAACGQLDARTMNEAADVWPGVERIVNQAADAGVDLLVLPEVTYPAYWLESADRYRQSDIERSEGVLRRFSESATQYSLWLVAGFVEEAGDLLYNSAAVFDRQGRLVATAWKQFMWDCDRQWFTPGDQSIVVETEFGRMGIQICADMRMPEISATLVSQGAEFIVQPTAWVNTSRSPRECQNIQPDFLIRARAIEFGLPIICCSKSGREGTAMTYVGQSRIVSSNGEVLADAPIEGDDLVVARVAPAAPHPLNIDASMMNRLLSKAPPSMTAPDEGKYAVMLRQNADAIADVLSDVGVQVSRLTADDLSTFAPARCCALDGIHVLVMRGTVSDDALVRARAAENCLFIIVASERAQLVVDPRGEIIWRRVDQADTVDLEVRQAAVKAFTPTTDIWSQRRVETYRLT